MATSNDMATKRATLLSEKTSTFMKRDLSIQIVNSAVLKKRLLEAIGKHAGLLTDKQKELGEAALLYLFLAYFYVKLPTPTNGLRQKKDDFDEFIESLDAILDQLFSDEIYDGSEEGNGADLNGDQVKKQKQMYRTLFILDWCREHNFMTEVLTLMEIDDKDADGTRMAVRSLENYLKIAHIVKANGLKMEAVKIVATNQWKAVREALNKHAYEGDGTGDADDTGGSSDSGGGDDTGTGDGGSGEAAGGEGGGDGASGDGGETPA
jgi:hypothetical protein